MVDEESGVDFSVFPNNACANQSHKYVREKNYRSSGESTEGFGDFSFD
jgi:hypothetical protein